MDEPTLDSAVIMSDQVIIDGKLTALSLHSDGNLRWVDSGKDRCLNLEKEVIGVSLEDSRVVVKCAVESGGGVVCCKSMVKRTKFQFQPCSQDFRDIWFQKIREYLHSLDRPKRLFVLVNPYGGKKSASATFVHVVKPLLDDAEIQITLQETKYQLHAKELVYGLDLTKYDGIVCVSGDGILVEVVNGLLERNDWATAIKKPIGVIPAGTGNGMAKSLLDSVGYPCSAFNAALAIIRGHKRSLDVVTVSQGKTRFFSVLMLAWGLVADIDIESEKWRWMGSARIELYAIQRIISLRKYNGRIHFVPASGYEAYVDKISQKVESLHDVPLCTLSEKEIGAQSRGYAGPNIDLCTMNWRTIDGPFVSVWIHNVPWGGEDAMAAPEAKFSDGCVDVILIKVCPKLGLLSILTEVSKGNHVKSPHVLYFKVKAFVLEPGAPQQESTRGGIIDCDGEVLARGNGTYKCDQKSLMSYDRLQITIDQALATLFSPPT